MNMIMTIKHCLLLILMFVLQNQAIAQKPDIIRCGTVEHNEYLRSQHPSLSNTAEFEKWMAQRISEIKRLNDHKPNPENQKYGIQKYVIPIIFHIIHNGEAVGATPNIAAQYIDAQLEQLNLDFANLSGSSYGVAADAEIQFCAAKIDPDGNCLAEPGINRINRNDLGLNAPPYSDTYFNTSIKPNSQWNPDHYLNIWTGDLSGLLGFAQLPEASYLEGIHNNNGLAITDGCVIKYSAIGSVAVPFPSGNEFNLGRTLTHEIGHFLGLRHTWGDGACDKDDFCEDTPRQGNSSSGCPVGNDSCSSEPGLDMVENYMDYSNDDCMHTFTADQRDRMLVVMDPELGSVRRASLNDSPACGCAPDAAFSPTGNITVCSSTNTIQFLNESVRTESNSTFSWTFSGAGVSPSNSNLENPTVTISTAGNLTVKLTVTTNNGSDTTGPTNIIVNTVASAPSSPALNSPANTTIQTSLSPTLSWSSVPTADNYFIEVATDPAMTSIILANLVSSTMSSVYGLSPLTTYYWRVIPVNDCNSNTIYTGNSSAIWSFETINTSCTNYTATDTPKVISSSGAPTVSSVITMPSGLGSIANFKLSKLSLEHSYVSDLTISLKSPDGISALLVREICGSSDDLNLIFDDGGNPNSSIPCPPTDGNAYQAQSPFAIFNGTDPAGDWTLTISDAASFDGGQLLCWEIDVCTEDVLTCPGSLTVSTTSNNVSCFGQSAGIVSATPFGGNTPYSYVWQNSMGQSVGTTATVIDLPADTYTVFLTDGNGCVVQDNTVVSQPQSALSNTAMPKHVSCYVGNDGTISNMTVGGTGTYTYNWSTGATSQNISNLAAGIYTLTITDGNNCTVTETINITQPSAPLSITETINHIDCAGNNSGNIILSVSGGTAGYTYAWSNGATTSSINTITANTYTVTVSDANSCTITDTYIVTEPSQQLSLLLQTKTDVSCNGNSDGELDVQISGGTIPYAINWSNGASGQYIQNLAAAQYTITVTDDNGCSVSANWTITEPTPLDMSFSAVSAVICNNEINGTATASASGGTGPYGYAWSSGETSPSASNLAAGINTVTITDDHNCTLIETINIGEPTAITITIDQVNQTTCPNSSDGLITVSASGGTGSIMLNWSTGSTNQTIANLSAGVYAVTATDLNGCEQIISVTIADPVISIGTTTSPPSCQGNADGSASVMISGGQSPYTYLWSTGDTQSTITNKIAGTYSVSIEDDNGCQFTEILTIPPATLSVISSASNLTCQSNSNGTLWALASGGVAPYTYEWKDSNGTVVAQNGLPAGTYTLIASDANGCMVTTSATINTPVNEFTNANNNKLTGQQGNSVDYEVDGKIESNQIIDSNGNAVDYDSGISIEMEAGFEVKIGSLFHAFIDGCGGTM